MYLRTIILTFLYCGLSAAQSDYHSYYSQNFLGFTSPGAMKYGLYGHDNPALLSTLTHSDFYLTWSDLGKRWNDFNHWGLFMAVPNFGFSAVTTRAPGITVTDYKLSTGFGSKAFGIGFGYGWSAGDWQKTVRSDLFTAGTFLRPNPYTSIGITGFLPTRGEAEAAFDLAIRPFGNEIVSLFGDYVYRKDRKPGDIKWSGGAAFEVLPGVRVTGRYFNTKFFNVGVQLGFGSFGVAAQSSFDKNNKHLSNIYGLRIGGYDRNIFSSFSKRNTYAELNLLGPVKYQRFRFFDNSNTLSGLLEQIDAAANDPTVSGIALNTSGMMIDRVKMWEIREKLREFKNTGKKVFVYLDRAGIDQYHFASIADQIVMDPLGILTLEGYVAGRTFFKGTLEKLGIGYEEWRYFKYKSAYENFSEEKMSEGDREQRLKLIEDNYNLVRRDITEARSISANSFDEMVNDVPIFLSDEALNKGLVDKIGRWEDLKELVKEVEGKPKNFKSITSLEKFNLPEDNYWGEKPSIAVIYALGVCAMDEGITARKLVSDVKSAADNPNVKAIVFRIDSPGGDALASDIVAGELQKAKDKKPVIISQGLVAASGGYWLSMYGDTIVAAPNTITGSIGVIGGWFYNKELKEKLGMSTDHVKVGRHADLGFGFTIPLLGLSVPDRNFTEDEMNTAENLIRTSYKEFINKVSSGRNMTIESVEEIAQGRVWSGTDAKRIGIVDVIGGLNTAIDIAVERAGLTAKHYRLIEMPEAPWFDISRFMPKLFSVELKEKDEFVDHIKFRLQNNGIPMPMLPLEEMDWMNSY